MSVVVAVRNKEDGSYVFAADRLGSGSRFMWELATERKIQRLGLYVVGFVGSFRSDQIVRAHDAWKSYPPMGVSLARHLITAIMPALRRSLKEEGALQSEKGADSTVDGSNMMVAFLNQACRIQGNFAVMEIGSYDAIGSGQEYAIGSMHTATNLQLPAVDIARAAVAAAIAHNPNVGGEIDIMKSAQGISTARPKSRKRG